MTVTTPFDMTVLNDLDRFHLVMDAIDRLAQTGGNGIYLKQQLKDKLLDHKHYIRKHGEDLPAVRRSFIALLTHEPQWNYSRQ